MSDLYTAMKPARGKEESFEDYKKRRKMVNIFLKIMRRGRIFFHSGPDMKGRYATYRKSKDANK